MLRLTLTYAIPAAHIWQSQKDYTSKEITMSNLPGNDHVAVAKFRLEGVHDWQSDEGSTDATNLAAAIDAQTHATLALAYEQRTANLIAVMALAGTKEKIWQEVYDRLGLGDNND